MSWLYSVWPQHQQPAGHATAPKTTLCYNLPRAAACRQLEPAINYPLITQLG